MPARCRHGKTPCAGRIYVATTIIEIDIEKAVVNRELRGLPLPVTAEMDGLRGRSDLPGPAARLGRSAQLGGGAGRRATARPRRPSCSFEPTARRSAPDGRRERINSRQQLHKYLGLGQNTSERPVEGIATTKITSAAAYSKDTGMNLLGRLARTHSWRSVPWHPMFRLRLQTLANKIHTCNKDCRRQGSWVLWREQGFVLHELRCRPPPSAPTGPLKGFWVGRRLAPRQGGRSTSR